MVPLILDRLSTLQCQVSAFILKFVDIAMKLTFVYTDMGIDNARKFNQGVAQLSSCLKQAGHKTSLVHIFEEINQEDYVKLIHTHSPDIIAFSSISNLYPKIKQFAAWTKNNFDVPIIYGGPHPTLVPDGCMNTGLFDIICRGEGEQALVELCNALEKREKITEIKNLWVKTDNRIYKNPIRPLIEDLDSLPSLDYELFNYETLADATHFKRLVIMVGRGCPYNCTYCCNHAVRELYPNKKRYVRFRSVDKVISEIEYGLNKYPFLKEVRFFDDTLTIKKSWFSEFAEKYKEKIGLPYSANDRVNHINEDIAELLRDSGCYFVELGIESGNERIREEVMQRGTSEERIINAFDLCRKYGIKTSAFNIIGVPGETFGSTLDTIKLNARAKPDWSYIFYFHPYIGTRLYDLCVEKRLLTNKTFKTIYEGPALNLESITEQETNFAFNFFRPLIKLYKFYYRFPRPVFNCLDKVTVGLLSQRFPRTTVVTLMPYCIMYYEVLKMLMKAPLKAFRKIKGSN